MSKINWPPDFDPAAQRAYIDEKGEVFFIPIPIEVRAIPYIEPENGADPFSPRIERARVLAEQGHVIDVPVDVWGWGAENTMRLRRLYGKAWVPDALGVKRILVPPER